MIELYYWPTSNGHKITIFLEEAKVPYEIKPVNIAKGEQFQPDFLKISPNNRMPAIIDRAPLDAGGPLSVFESGAILLYLADKTKQLIPADTRGRIAALEWMFWQVGGLGPMAGQRNHFLNAQEKLPYAIKRYTDETDRLIGVLDRRLADHEYLAGAYSVADIMSYPWVNSSARQGDPFSVFKNLKRWFEAIKARPAVIEAYRKGEDYKNPPEVTEAGKKILYGQTAASVKALQGGA
jgi:GST-like protein